MAQQPHSIAQIYKQFTDRFSPTDNARDVVRFAKRRLSVDLKYGVVQKFLTEKKKWDERICEALDSELGQDWYYETIQQSSCYQKWLIDCYFKQKHHTTSSLVSIAILINAKLLSNYYLSKYDDDEQEDNKIEFDSDDEQDINTLKSTLPFLTESKLIEIFPQYSSRITIDKVLVSGMSLDELGQVLLDIGCKSVTVEHCNRNEHSSGPKASVAIFRELCRHTFSKHNMDIDSVIICNFDPWELDTGIEGGMYGHISPIAAYHEDSDRVLLLDTFSDELWVKLESLYKAMMCTQQNKTNTDIYRGYVVVHDPPIWGQTQTNNMEHMEGYTLPNDVNDEYSDHTLKRKRNKKERHRSNNSVTDFDFVLFDNKSQQNYNENKRKSQRRRSRRISQKLNMYLAFDSENGQSLWKETQSSEYHQKWSVVQYFQQTQSTSCALVAIAICFNAKAMAYFNTDDNKNSVGYHDEDDDIFKLDEDRMMDLYRKYYTENEGNKHQYKHVPTVTRVISDGMCLEETGDVLRLFGCKSVCVMYTYQMGMDSFRDLVKDVLKEGSRNNDKVMLVNYDLLKLGTGIGSGSLSVIAGYNVKNDMILLLNTSWIVGKCWVRSQLLYDAMNTVDDNVGTYRGCVVVEGLPLFM